MSSVTAEITERPAVWRDGKRFLWPLALAVPMLPLVCFGIVGKSGHEGWWWLGAVLVFVQVPLMDRMIGSDDGNPPEDLVRALQSDRFYRWMTFLYLPLLFVGLAIGCWQWVSGDLGWVGRLGMITTVGIVSGIAINTAHELGHKVEKLERRLSKIALAPSAYGHFYVEHNRGHHIRVATPEDAASARLGEGFWRFWPRVMWGSLHHAVSMEWKRFRRRGKSPWTWRNDVLNAWALTVVLWAAFVVWLGPGVLWFLVPQAVIGFTLLESVNYLEHYGLRRQLTPYGRYENVDARHSWNSDRLATNLFLYQLQRHSDHHANPTRRYQVLRSLDVSPQLPAGYASMIVLSFVPPLWRRVMDHRVVEHYGGDLSLANVHEPARRRLERRFGTPAAEQAESAESAAVE